MPPRPAARIVATDDNSCPQTVMLQALADAVGDLAKNAKEQAEASKAQAVEFRKMRLTLQAGIRQMQPACTAVRGLCAVAKKWGPWMLASAPGVLLAIGAISPNAAKALAVWLAGVS
jgi:hypothetical protein